MTADTGKVYFHALVNVDAHLADAEATQRVVLEDRSNQVQGLNQVPADVGLPI